MHRERRMCKKMDLFEMNNNVIKVIVGECRGGDSSSSSSSPFSRDMFNDGKT
jgi:hypothetical protein